MKINTFHALNKAVSALLILGLLFPPSAYSTDVLATQRSDARFQLQNDIALTARAELRLQDFQEIVKRETEKRKQTTWSVVNVSFREFLGEIPYLPEEIRQVADKTIEQFNSKGKFKNIIGDWRVMRIGESLHFLLAHKVGEENAVIHRIIMEATYAAFEKAREMRLIDDETYAEFHSLTEQEKIAQFNLNNLEISRMKRPADPHVVGVFQNIDLPMLNRIVRRLIGGDAEGYQSLLSIEGVAGFRVKLRHIEDIRNGKPDGHVLELNSATDNELLTNVLMSQEWIPVEITALGGRAMKDQLPETPAVRISVDQAFTDGKFKPRTVTFYVASQTGLWGVGEIAEILTRPIVGVGGQNAGHNVVLVPVSVEDAAQTPARPGYATVTLYGFQAAEKVDGSGAPRMPTIVDYIAQTPDVYRKKREQAQRLRKLVDDHAGFPIELTDQYAREQAEKLAQDLDRYLRPIPPLQEDPLREAANKKGKYTRSLFKADVGGELGHTTPPWFYYLVGRAAAQTGIENKLFIDAKIMHKEVSGKKFPFGTGFPGGVGDDVQFVATHTNGLNSQEVHAFFMRTFLMMGVVARWLGEDPYGWLQDIVGPELLAEIATNGKLDIHKLEAKAGVKTEEGQRIIALFLDELEQARKEGVLDREQKKYTRIIRDANQKARDYHPGQAVKEEGGRVYEAKPFSGNVQGMGPGWAEYNTDNPRASFATHHTDKDGPAFFNIPTLKAAEEAFRSGLYKEGIAFEIYDTIAHKRIFLDLETQSRELYTFLGDVHRYNIKKLFRKTQRRWSKKASGDPLELLKYVDPLHFFEASTEKLSIITGGEYRGKDDAVAIMTLEFNQFFKKEAVKYTTQGDARGSFTAIPRPSGLLYAVATDNSRPIQVNLEHQATADGKIALTRDVFESPEYAALAEEIEELNKLLWGAQGLFPPVGPTPDKVEPSYPVIETYKKVTGQLPISMVRGIHATEAVPHKKMVRTLKKVTGEEPASLLGSQLLGHAHGEHSPYKQPYRNAWNDVYIRTALVNRFPGLAHRLSPEAVALGHKDNAPQVILVDSELLESDDFDETLKKLREITPAIEIVETDKNDLVSALKNTERINGQRVAAVIARQDRLQSFRRTVEGRSVLGIALRKKARGQKSQVSAATALFGAVEALANPGAKSVRALGVPQSEPLVTLAAARADVRFAPENTVEIALGKAVRIGSKFVTLTASLPNLLAEFSIQDVSNRAESRAEAKMLVLSRQRNESIIIGDNIIITVVDIRGDKVRLGIEAPKDIPVHREEVKEAIDRENERLKQEAERKAAQRDPKGTSQDQAKDEPSRADTRTIRTHEELWEILKQAGVSEKDILAISPKLDQFPSPRIEIYFDAKGVTRDEFTKAKKPFFDIAALTRIHEKTIFVHTVIRSEYPQYDTRIQRQLAEHGGRTAVLFEIFVPEEKGLQRAESRTQKPLAVLIGPIMPYVVSTLQTRDIEIAFISPEAGKEISQKGQRRTVVTPSFDEFNDVVQANPRRSIVLVYHAQIASLINQGLRGPIREMNKEGRVTIQEIVVDPASGLDYEKLDRIFLPQQTSPARADARRNNIATAIQLGSIFSLDFYENISDALIDRSIASGATEFTMNPYSTGNYIRHLLTLTTPEGQAWAKRLLTTRDTSEVWSGFKQDLAGIEKSLPQVFKAIKAALEPAPDITSENEQAFAREVMASMLREARFVRQRIEELAAQGKNGEDVYWSVTKYLANKIATRLFSIFQKSQGRTGFVSIEVDPRIEREDFIQSHAGQIENKRAWAIDQMRKEAADLQSIQPNILVKAPSTEAGIGTISAVNAHFNTTLEFVDDDAREAIAAYESRGDQEHILRNSPFVSRNAVYFSEFWSGLLFDGDWHSSTIINTHETYEALAKEQKGYEKGAIWSSLGIKIKGDPGELYAKQVVGVGIINMPPETARDFNQADIEVERKFGQKPLSGIISDYFLDIIHGKVPSGWPLFQNQMYDRRSPAQQADIAIAEYQSIRDRQVTEERLQDVEARIQELEAKAGKPRTFTREAGAQVRARIQAGETITEKELMRVVLKKEGEEKFIVPFDGAIKDLQTAIDQIKRAELRHAPTQDIDTLAIRYDKSQLPNLLRSTLKYYRSEAGRQAAADIVNRLGITSPTTGIMLDATLLLPEGFLAFALAVREFFGPHAPIAVLAEANPALDANLAEINNLFEQQGMDPFIITRSVGSAEYVLRDQWKVEEIKAIVSEHSIFAEKIGKLRHEIITMGKLQSLFAQHAVLGGIAAQLQNYFAEIQQLDRAA